mmetsp:Transcript_15752/g.35365  ORF Transcript_15752/g.35365 Transcript_15752/m.35365 type:complete len:284 (+) Transcript_15752:15-866(+)
MRPLWLDVQEVGCFDAAFATSSATMLIKGPSMLLVQLFALAPCVRAITVASSPCDCPGLSGASGPSDVEVSSDLVEDIQSTKVAIRATELKHERLRDYYSKHQELLKKQLAAYTRVAQGAQTSAASANQEEYYANRMCALLANAVYVGDKDAELEVHKLCMGRSTMALVSDFKDKKCACARGERLTQLRSTEDAPVHDLRATLQRLQAQLGAAKAALAAEPGMWANSTQDMQAELDSLENRTSNAFLSKATAQQQAWARVRERYCEFVGNGGGVVKAVELACQ